MVLPAECFFLPKVEWGRRSILQPWAWKFTLTKNFHQKRTLHKISIWTSGGRAVNANVFPRREDLYPWGSHLGTVFITSFRHLGARKIYSSALSTLITIVQGLWNEPIYISLGCESPLLPCKCTSKDSFRYFIHFISPLPTLQQNNGWLSASLITPHFMLHTSHAALTFHRSTQAQLKRLWNYNILPGAPSCIAPC